MNNTDCKQLNPRRAFTLIEILVVIALTAVLFALLIIPLVSALNYTRQAQLVTAAQDAARSTRERITRELSSAVFVFDGTSHPFQVPAGTTPNPGDDRYTNFLDLQMLNKTGGPVVAHAYNAKLDFVLAKTSKGDVIDPTVGDPATNASQGINYTRSANGSAIISNPSLVFPLAAGSTMTRYFVGLRDPSKPYNNTREGKANGSDDNTYILYRAEFSPYTYNLTPGLGKPAASANPALFAARPKLDANNQPVIDKYGNTIYIPELDDPDFFRYVGGNDTNWLSDTHSAFTAAEVIAHNGRVDKWMQISKPVIPGPNVDLLLLPHNADNTLAYDGAGGSVPGVAHSGVAHDPVPAMPGTDYPIVNTSVTFRPATVSGNATPGTTSDYNSSGVVSVDQSGFTYIPTVYTATSQSWSLPFHISLYPSTANATMYSYDTDQWQAGSLTFTPAVGGVSVAPGDVVEYRTDSTGRVPVYNATQGFPFYYNGTSYVIGGTKFAPMTVNPDTGTIMFSAPSLPNGPGDRSARAWNYGTLAAASTSPTQAELDAQNTGGVDSGGNLDLTLPVSTTASLKDSPLAGFHLLTASGSVKATGVENAHIVPGSIRVTGPDRVPGPNLGQPISYTEISYTASVVSDNQYSVDYSTSTLHLVAGVTGVSVVYDYQANMTLTDSTAAFSAANTYQPMQVKVDYQTRDLIDVNIGVRIYDVSTNRAQVIPTETKVKIGNSNR